MLVIHVTIVIPAISKHVTTTTAAITQLGVDQITFHRVQEIEVVGVANTEMLPQEVRAETRAVCCLSSLDR